MSNVKDTVLRQYARIMNNAAQEVSSLKTPNEGWIKTMRKALGMSAPDLARHLGVTKPAIYQAERKERDQGITLKQMQRLANAMGGKFVYAIVPDGKIEDILHNQARAKAKSIVANASVHMALEDQLLSPELLQEEIERVATRLLIERPLDFWKTP